MEFKKMCKTGWLHWGRRSLFIPTPLRILSLESPWSVVPVWLGWYYCPPCRRGRRQQAGGEGLPREVGRLVPLAMVPAAVPVARRMVTGSKCISSVPWAVPWLVLPAVAWRWYRPLNGGTTGQGSSCAPTLLPFSSSFIFFPFSNLMHT
jgi:hypothetical protein